MEIKVKLKKPSLKAGLLFAVGMTGFLTLVWAGALNNAQLMGLLAMLVADAWLYNIKED